MHGKGNMYVLYSVFMCLHVCLHVCFVYKNYNCSVYIQFAYDNMHVHVTRGVIVDN